MNENVTLTEDTIYRLYGYNQRTGEYVELCDFDLDGEIDDENT